jgi:hypothetical protein
MLIINHNKVYLEEILFSSYIANYGRKTDRVLSLPKRICYHL